MRETVVGLLFLFGLVASAAVEAAPAGAPARALAIEVRSAPLGNVVAQMAAAGERRMRVEPDAADARVTLFAPRTSLEEFEHAVATLFGCRWRSGGAPKQPLRILERDPQLAARVAAFER